jgi:hypothetical protein
MPQLVKIIKIFKEFIAEHLNLFWLLFLLLIVEGVVASGVVLTMILFEVFFNMTGIDVRKLEVVHL